MAPAGRRLFGVDLPWIDAVVVVVLGLGGELVVPVTHVLCHLLLPGQVVLLAQEGEEAGEGRLDVRPDAHLGGVAQPQLLGAQVDLDGAGLTRLRQELAVRVVGAEQHEGVALPHLVVAGP